jgi:small subunit ribosomal protein S6
MSKYESVAVFSVKEGEEKAKALVEKFKALIEANGTMEAVDEWGLRKLAYPINYEPDGYYVLYTFEAGVDFPAELERVYNITDGVLRSLIVAR